MTLGWQDDWLAVMAGLPPVLQPGRLPPGQPLAAEGEEEKTRAVGAGEATGEKPADGPEQETASSPHGDAATMPDEATLARAVTKKFLPRLKGSAALRRLYLRDNKDAIELRDGSTIYLSSALSPAQRASVTVLHEFLDEVDLYRQLAGQGDPINELRERTISYGPKRRVLAVAKPMASGSDREDALYDRLGPLAVVRLSGPMSKDGNLWWGITSMGLGL